MGPAPETPTTQIVSITNGAFGLINVEWSEIVETFPIPDVNLQAQRGTPTWHNCQGGFPAHTTFSGLQHDGGSDDVTRWRILANPVTVIPDVNPIAFPIEVPVPFP